MRERYRWMNEHARGGGDGGPMGPPGVEERKMEENKTEARPGGGHRDDAPLPADTPARRDLDGKHRGAAFPPQAETRAHREIDGKKGRKFSIGIVDDPDGEVGDYPLPGTDTPANRAGSYPIPADTPAHRDTDEKRHITDDPGGSGFVDILSPGGVATFGAGTPREENKEPNDNNPAHRDTDEKRHIADGADGSGFVDILSPGGVATFEAGTPRQDNETPNDVPPEDAQEQDENVETPCNIPE